MKKEADMDEERWLEDRVNKIRETIEGYGEENFMVSFSGGRDSTVMHYLLDYALPDNRIPRVYANTGVELNSVVGFVKSLAQEDDRFIILTPKVPVKEVLEDAGYPFKSKTHSKMVYYYQNGCDNESVKAYLSDKYSSYKRCPDKLKYQFTDEFKLRVSDLCCELIKEYPLNEWAKENKKSISMIGLVREEGGRRYNARCMVFEDGKLKAFQPLAPVSKEWEDWFMEKIGKRYCELYYPPYNFERTGCKGCPFATNLQDELDVLEIFFPNERKQCEILWHPVYEEYRRIKYRLWV